MNKAAKPLVVIDGQVVVKFLYNDRPTEIKRGDQLLWSPEKKHIRVNRPNGHRGNVIKFDLENITDDKISVNFQSKNCFANCANELASACQLNLRPANFGKFIGFTFV